MHYSLFATIALAASQVCALARSPAASVVNGRYVVDNQYTFTNRSIWNFTSQVSLTTTLPAGLGKSSYSVGTHKYEESNVDIQNGFLNLRVPGGQTAQPYKTAEVVTAVNNIRYASVRTIAIFSEPAGVCNGIFYYKNDTQETDIEWLSDKDSLSNGGTRKLWLTNQDADLNGIKTYNAITPPSNPTVERHEYRLDWTPGLVRWFVDGVQVWSTTSDVPTAPGPWVFNNWSNGDNGWSVGPPATLANFRIGEIVMYYNTF